MRGVFHIQKVESGINSGFMQDIPRHY